MGNDCLRDVKFLFGIIKNRVMDRVMVAQHCKCTHFTKIYSLKWLKLSILCYVSFTTNCLKCRRGRRE